MKRFIIWWGLVCLMLGNTGMLPAQLGTPPGNDHCHNARPIAPGQRYAHVDNAFATRGLPFANPDTLPGTCIQSLENDLWYSFTATDEFPVYEIIIASHSCNTPAGLQALLIETDDCNAKHYRYRACSNTQTLDSIKLYLENPTPGQQYLIYIDGYDGTMCDFDVILNGKTQIDAPDYRFLRFSYDLDRVAYGIPDGLATTFENNQAVLRWEVDPGQDIAYFVVERIPEYFEELEEEDRYTQVVGIIDPNNRVNAGATEYEFRDYITSFEPDKDYTYRLLTVSSKGEREVSENIALRAKIITSFYVAPVEESSQSGIYKVIYLNKRKKQTFDLRVENSDGEAVKSMQLEKIKAPDGEVTIDMRAFEPGRYWFIMNNGEDEFIREFYVNEP